MTAAAAGRRCGVGLLLQRVSHPGSSFAALSVSQCSRERAGL